jgi:hypothetical protein
LLPYPWLVSFLENSGLPGAAERCSVMSLTPIPELLRYADRATKTGLTVKVGLARFFRGGTFSERGVRR